MRRRWGVSDMRILLVIQMLVADPQTFMHIVRCATYVWFGHCQDFQGLLIDLVRDFLMNFSYPGSHPGWKYVMWDDRLTQALLRTYYPWFLPIDNGYTTLVAKSDSIRLFVLHIYGGVYLVS